MSLIRRLRAAFAAFQKPSNYRDPLAEQQQSVEERKLLQQERKRDALVHLNNNARFIAVKTINTGEVPAYDDLRALIDGMNDLPAAMRIYAMMAVTQACPEIMTERLFVDISKDKDFVAAAREFEAA